MSTLAIVEAFSELPDPRRGAGCRHEYAVCLALFTLAISAGCGGFLAIGDWLEAYRSPLIELFGFPKHGIPTYSTLRRALLGLDYQTYRVCVTNFFKIEPQSGETIALDGKVLRGSYTIETGANRTESHLRKLSRNRSTQHPSIQRPSIQRLLIAHPKSPQRS